MTELASVTEAAPPAAEPSAAESYYLEELDRYQPGDRFPNVGYVRRMTALLQS